MMLRAEFTGVGPKYAVLVGVTAKQCNFYESMSEELRQAVPAVIDEVIRQAELSRVKITKKIRLSPLSGGIPPPKWQRIKGSSSM
jgi:hypothetical protein